MTQASTTGPVAGETNPRLERITLHWTAGNYVDTYNHYHYCIRGDGVVVNTLPVAAKGSHTWKRNTGNIGTSMCAMGEAAPVLALQRERNARLIAELCHKHGIPLHGTVPGQPEYRYIAPDQLVPTGRLIALPTVTDHLWYAKADGYYPERVDVGEALLALLLKKAEWYLQHLEAVAATGQNPYQLIR